METLVGKSTYPNHGERVVVGQHLMQAASDVFLGWTHGRAGRNFYVRQLRDMKIKPPVELFSPSAMLDYATLCGWTLARAHARSGDPAMMAGYIGKSMFLIKLSLALAKPILTKRSKIMQSSREL